MALCTLYTLHVYKHTLYVCRYYKREWVYPVTFPIRTALDLWRGAAPSVNCERQSVAAARNSYASLKAAARLGTVSPKTPGNYPPTPTWHLSDQLQVTHTLCTGGLVDRAVPPALSLAVGVLTKIKRRDLLYFAGGEVMKLKSCLHIKWWRGLLLAHTHFSFSHCISLASFLTSPCTVFILLKHTVLQQNIKTSLKKKYEILLIIKSEERSFYFNRQSYIVIKLFQ